MPFLQWPTEVALLSPFEQSILASFPGSSSLILFQLPLLTGKQLASRLSISKDAFLCVGEREERTVYLYILIPTSHSLLSPYHPGRNLCRAELCAMKGAHNRHHLGTKVLLDLKVNYSRNLSKERITFFFKFHISLMLLFLLCLLLMWTTSVQNMSLSQFYLWVMIAILFKIS